ncbi:unnamed protein product, partial [Cuscuta campestris]
VPVGVVEAMTVLKHPLPSAQGFVGFEKQKVCD